MSIKSLLNKGDVNCSTLEKVADAILTAPRGMWLGRNVTLTKNSDGTAEAHHDPRPSSLHDKMCRPFNFKNTDEGTGGVLLVVGIFYLLAFAVLALPLALGLSLKKIAVSRDDKSARFQKIVESRLKLDNEVNKQNELKQNREKIDQSIQILEKNLAELPSNNYLIIEPKKRAENNLNHLRNDLSKTQENLTKITEKVNEFQKNYQKAMEGYIQ